MTTTHATIAALPMYSAETLQHGRRIARMYRDDRGVLVQVGWSAQTLPRPQAMTDADATAEIEGWFSLGS